MADQKVSLFSELVDYNFGPVIRQIVAKINGEEKEKQLLIQQLFRKEFSVTMDWESISVDNSVVAADVVSMDSTLPLKSRGTISAAKGEIPKIGISFGLKESDIKKLQLLAAQGGAKAEIVAKVMADAVRVVMGIMYRLEIQAHQALSSGVMGIPPEQEGGAMVRLTYGAKAENNLKAAVKWSETTRTPITDLKAMFDKASDNEQEIKLVLMDKAALDAIRNSDEGRMLYAGYLGSTQIDPSKATTPNKKQILLALADEFEAEFKTVKSNLRTEGLDGKKKVVNAWTPGAVVGLPSDTNAGRIHWNTVAEHDNRVEGVKYEVANDFILVSKYSETNPLSEVTGGQALAIPVLDNVDAIYRLSTIY